MEIKRIHQEHNGCTPTVAGVVQINEDYSWVTEHKRAHEDPFQTYGCAILWETTEYETATFNAPYYADVPDDVSAATIRLSAWHVPPGLWDVVLVEGTVNYNIGPSYSGTFSNAGHSIRFGIFTTYLGKVHTLALTDGNATAQADNRQIRYLVQDCYFVFLVEAPPPPILPSPPACTPSSCPGPSTWRASRRSGSREARPGR